MSQQLPTYRRIFRNIGRSTLFLELTVIGNNVQTVELKPYLGDTRRRLHVEVVAHVASWLRRAAVKQGYATFTAITVPGEVPRVDLSLHEGALKHSPNARWSIKETSLCLEGEATRKLYELLRDVVEPVESAGYRHTLVDEQGDVIHTHYTDSADSPFGVSGDDYDKAFTATCRELIFR